MAPARPLKLKTPPPDKSINLNLHQYLERQNEVAESLRSYQQMANGLLQMASQQIGTLSQALTGLQQSTRMVLEANEIDPTDEKLEQYMHIAPILKMDKAELNNTLSLASTDLAALALRQQKKQKKPRKPRDPNAPQRPHTAFFLFQAANREKFRDDMRQADPDVKPGQVQSRLTEVWNKMTPEEQKPYKDQYQQQNEAYNRAKLEYEAQHGKGGEEAAAMDGDHAVGALASSALAVEDASGDPDSGDDDSSNDSSDSSEDSSASPTPPPPKRSKDKKEKKQKVVPAKVEASSPEKKKKRKHERAETAGDDVGSKRKKTSEEVERPSKKDKKKGHDSNIDPELSRLDKQQRKEKKEKHPEGYAPAQQSAPGFPHQPPVGFPPRGFQQPGFPPMSPHFSFQYPRGGM